MISAISIILMNITLLTTASVMHSGDTLDAPYGIRPVIDGMISFGEWDDADTVMTLDLPDGPVTIYAKEYPIMIYLAVVIPDNTYHPNDEIVIYVDSLNNGGTQPQVDDFGCSIHRNGNLAGLRGNGITWVIESLWGWTAMVTTTPTGWTAEIAITFTKAGLSVNIPKTLGFATELINTTHMTVTWPDSAVITQPNTWGDLSSRDNWSNTDSTGPIASSLSISPPNPPQGITEIVVYAVVSDSTTGQSTISGAEAFIDSVGATGTGYAMTPLDGSYDEMTEDMLDTIPVSGWVTGDTHWVYVHGSDIANNWGMFDSLPVIVATALDTTPPWIIATFPDSGQTAVPLDPIITATFSEKVDPATVTSDKFTVNGSINGAYTFTLNYNTFDSTVYIDPTISFASAESITVTIAPGIQDLTGNPMPNAHSWWFKVLVLPDSVGPITSSVNISPPNPPQGITEIITYAHVSDSTTGQSLINDAEAFIDSIGQPGTGYVMTALDGTYDEIAEDVFDTIPVFGWVAGDTHWVYIHGRDIGNNWGAYDSASAIVVPLIDTIPPGIAYTSPAFGDTGVALNTWIYVIFTEQVDPATVTSDKVLVEGSINGNYTFWMSYFAADSTLRINPYNDFAPFESVNVYIASGIQDLAGNPMLTGYWWWFRTGAISDTTKPRVDSLEANPDTIIGATGITVFTSRVTDNTAVAGAEYFIDALGANGAGYPAHASDSFGLTIAHTLDTIVVDTLAYGLHRLFLHGMDAAGNWGPCDTTVMYKIAIDSVGPDFVITITPSPANIGDSVLIAAQASEVLNPDSAVTCLVRATDILVAYTMVQTDSLEYSVWVQTVGFSEDTCWALVSGYDEWSTYGVDSLQFAVMAEGEFLPKERVYAWPNPAKGSQVFFHFYVSMNAHVKVSVFNLEGKRIWQSAEQNAAGGKPPHTMNSNAVVWDISRIASDVYIFRLEATNTTTGDVSTVMKKFAVVR